VGLGAIALGEMLRREAAAEDRTVLPLAPKATHFPPRAKRVVFLFMAGGPSHLELFDYKPKLQELDGQVIPESYVAGKRFAFIKQDAKLLGTRRKFQRFGECGMELSEVIPQTAAIADEICLVRSMKTDVFRGRG
jgi:hypothetical protein